MVTGEKTETDRTSVIILTNLNRTFLLQQQDSLGDFILPPGALGGGDTVALAVDWNHRHWAKLIGFNEHFYYFYCEMSLTVTLS